MPDDELRREIERLRDWRHNQVVPELSSLRGRLHVAEGRLDKLEPQVERLARADEVAAAVKHALTRDHGLILTRAQKLGAAFGGTVLFGLAVADFVRSFFA